MNLITPILLLWGLFPFTQETGNSAQINEKVKPKYPFSSGLITYELSGDASGTAVLAFDRNGWRSTEKKELVFKRYGIESTEKSFDHIDGDYFYSANIDAGKGKKTIDKNWSSLLSYKTNDEAVSILMESKGGALSGTDSLLNFACRVWTFDKGAVKIIWEWQGIPMKVVKSLPGLTYTMQAVAIEKDAIIASETFALPEGVVWE